MLAVLASSAGNGNRNRNSVEDGEQTALARCPDREGDMRWGGG